VAPSGTGRRVDVGGVLRRVGVTVGTLLVALLACLAVLIALGEATRT
jgi:hypothetical protein